MSWDIELANELKKKENVVPIGVVEGEIISIDPTRISIKEGKIILEPEQIYVSRGLLTKHYKAKGTGKLKGNN